MRTSKQQQNAIDKYVSDAFKTFIIFISFVCKTMKMHSHKRISDMLPPALNVQTLYAIKTEVLASKYSQTIAIDTKHWIIS